MYIDHISITVSHCAKSHEFYECVLAPLGMGLLAEDNGWLGFGRGDSTDFWFGEGEVVTTPLHIAFVAANRAAVDAFYAAALSMGAENNGAPGLRPQYHEQYYGAFVIDPDGHNIEAVYHGS